MFRSSLKPLPLEQQTIVITATEKGLSFSLARLAAASGANVVLSSWNGKELQQFTDRLESLGRKIHPVIADATKLEDILKIRDEALKTFGRVDTWVNGAVLSYLGGLLDSDLREERRVFETNFWSTRLGSTIAVKAMADKGGTLINFGSEVEASSSPLEGITTASKLAIKALTESLRTELKTKKIPVSVCLVRPTQNNEESAEAVLKCALIPARDVYVGGPARLSAILDTFFPHVKDLVAESKLRDMKQGRKIL